MRADLAVDHAAPAAAAGPGPRDGPGPARHAVVGAGDRGHPAIARGRTNYESGAELFISLSTVKSRLASIQARLGLRNRVEIAAWAFPTRLVGGG